MIMSSLGPAKSISMLLVSLGVGYFVCAEAEKHKEGFVRQLGYWIGSVIIIVSILAAARGLLFNTIDNLICKASAKKSCPMMSGKMMHHGR